MSAATVPARIAAACPDVRQAAAADAIDGCMPWFVAAPASTEQAGAVLAAAAELGMTAVPRGGGTRLHWGMPPRRADLIIDTRRLRAVLEHAAGDLVVRVQAGVSLAGLARVLAAAGQRLALDPPPGSGGAEAGAPGAASAGTVGGLLATGVAGPLRLRYGAPRDLLIGITVVLADGTVAHSGGKVVKNVAGYDLGKLFAGSYGTLGLITEAAFRLHPLPQAVSYVTLACPGAAAAQAVMSAAAASALAPSAAELDWPGRDAPIRAGILLEGDRDGVAERTAGLCALLTGLVPGPGAGGPGAGRGRAVASPQPPPWWGRGAAAAAGGTVLRIAFWAGQTAAVLEAIAAAAAGAGTGAGTGAGASGAGGLDPAVSGSAAAGVLHVSLPARAEPAAVARFVTALRAAVGHGPALTGQPAAPPGSGPAPPGGSVVVLHAPPQVREAADLWGPVPAIALMRAVKDQFDPERRLAPGRFAGGI